MGDQKKLQKKGQNKMKRTTVQIPGVFYAHIENGDIRFTFSPSGSDAGYFGEDYYLLETNEFPEPDKEQLREKLFDLVSKKMASSPDHQRGYIVCEWEC